MGNTKTKEEVIYKYLKILIKVYLILSAVFVFIMSFAITYTTLYGYNKDGEYCMYTKDYENYHILLDGEPCILQWKMFLDFILINIMWIVILQTPAWLAFLGIKLRLKAINRKI